jgi:hypothetical protein
METRTSPTNLIADVINDNLKDHALAASDWRYREAVAVLHDWASRFNQEFGLDLQTAVIGLDRMSVRLLGTYHGGRNAVGLRHQILLNTAHLGRPLCEQLATLLHEQIHQWQSQFGRGGKNNYHNLQFRIMAAKFGLLEDDRGRTLGIEPGPFTNLLAKHGVDMGTLPLAHEKPVFTRRPKGDSKLRKWSCPCGTNVRCAVALKAQCLKCGGEFEEAEPAW